MTLSPQDNLLKWYLKNKRNLPFRLDKNPYNINGHATLLK